MRSAILAAALLACALLLLYGCTKTQPTETTPPPSLVGPAPKGETYFHIAWGIPLYWTIIYEENTYIIEAPEAGFYLEGSFSKEQGWQYIVLDGTGCDGIIAPYHLEKVGDLMYATSADFCERHFYLTGLWSKSKRPESSASKQNARPWRDLLKP